MEFDALLEQRRSIRRYQAQPVGKEQIEQAGCPVLGCIINKMTFDSISAKKYYNKSYYSHYGNAYASDRQKGAQK